jgi:hypothetical protein
MIKKCGFAAKGYGIAKSFAIVWHVGNVTAMAEFLPRYVRAASAHVRSVLASVVGDWLPLWGAVWSCGILWAWS